MTTTKIAGYSYDALTNTLTMTASFAKKASQLNTPEYKILLQLRLDNPGMKIEKATPKASSNRPVSIPFAKMEEYIAHVVTARNDWKPLTRSRLSPRFRPAPMPMFAPGSWITMPTTLNSLSLMLMALWL